MGCYGFSKLLELLEAVSGVVEVGESEETEESEVMLIRERLLSWLGEQLERIVREQASHSRLGLRLPTT